MKMITFKEDISNLSAEDLKSLFEMSYTKIRELDDRIKKFSLYAIIIVILYLISANTSFGTLQIGPISISDLPRVAELIPLLFSYLTLELATSTFHRFEVVVLTQDIFEKLNPEISKSKNREAIIKILFPFSIWTELANIENSSKIGCLLFSLLILVPTISVLFLPIAFQFVLLKDQYENLSTKLEVILFGLAIWLTIISIWYSVSGIRKMIKQKLE